MNVHLKQFTQFIYVQYINSFLRVNSKDFQQLNNGRKIVGIVINICSPLQIFLPILQDRELLTQVLAKESKAVLDAELYMWRT